MALSAAREGVLVAFDTVRSNRLRAALTVVGIAVGVATVTLTAAVLGGARAAVLDVIDASGPSNFMVMRFDPEQMQLLGSWDQIWGRNPRITLAERDRIAALPSVEVVSASVFRQDGELRAGAIRLGNILLVGADPNWPRFSPGRFVAGRDFIRAENERTARVIVISRPLARALFGHREAVGCYVEAGDIRLQVVGIFDERLGILGGDHSYSAWAPISTAMRLLRLDGNMLRVMVVPAAGIPRDRAIDEVIAALRTARHLRPAAPNTFAVKTQEALARMSMRWADIFFLVALVLSSIALLVGGVGLAGILMVSLAERTREIGLRKALGARRRDILWQFLAESVALTAVGGVAGLVLGVASAALLAWRTPVPAAVPWWSAAAALALSATAGLLFGCYPAARAARLDAALALRSE